MVTDGHDMPAGGPGAPELGPFASRKLPPVAHVAVAAMSLVLGGGIYIAAYLPRRVSLTPAVVLLAVAAALVLANAVQISRLKDFAWHAFWQVSGWALIAYVFIAGMIEFSFIHNGSRGSVLVVLSGMILLFALDIPMLLGFSVARYQEPR